jgi:hypothetical protein
MFDRIKDKLLDVLRAFAVDLVQDELDDIRAEISEVANGAVTDVSLKMDLDARDKRLMDRIGGAPRADPASTGTSLKGANLEQVNLSGANLCGADLSDAYLYAASLNGADLRGANLAEADLRRALLEGAHLCDAQLWKADLTGATWDDRPPPVGWKVTGGRLQRA